MRQTDEEAHDALAKMAREHVPGAGDSLTDEDINAVGEEPMDMRSALSGYAASRGAARGDPDIAQGVGSEAWGAKVAPDEDPMLARVGNQLGRGGSRGAADADAGATPPTVAGEAGMPSSPRGVMAAAMMGSTPKPAQARKPSAAQDTELRNLQAKAADERGANRIQQSVSAFTERPTNESDAIQQLGGVHPTAKRHASFLESDEAQHNLEDLGTRRASESAMAAKSEAADPNSSTANTYRAALKKIAPDLDLSTATAPQMEKIAPWLREYAKAPNAENNNRLSLEQERTDLMRQKLELERQKLAKKGAAKGAPGATSDADQVAEGIANGSLPPPSPRQKDYQSIMAKVLKLKPDYDATTQPTYAHARSNQSTNSALLSGKAVRHHMDELKQAVDDMDEGVIDAPWANKLAQGYAEGTGSDKYTRLQTAAQVVGSELSQAFQEGDAAGREHVKHLVRPEQTKKQWAQSLAELEKLRDEKIGVSEQVLSDLGPKKSAKSPETPAIPKKVDHYLVSPDKKLRVPVYADGSEGPEEPVR